MIGVSSPREAELSVRIRAASSAAWSARRLPAKGRGRTRRSGRSDESMNARMRPDPRGTVARPNPDASGQGDFFRCNVSESIPDRPQCSPRRRSRGRLRNASTNRKTSSRLARAGVKRKRCADRMCPRTLPSGAARPRARAVAAPTIHAVRAREHPGPAHRPPGGPPPPPERMMRGAPLVSARGSCRHTPARQLSHGRQRSSPSVPAAPRPLFPPDATRPAHVA